MVTRPTSGHNLFTLDPNSARETLLRYLAKQVLGRLKNKWTRAPVMINDKLPRYTANIRSMQRRSCVRRHPVAASRIQPGSWIFDNERELALPQDHQVTWVFSVITASVTSLASEERAPHTKYEEGENTRKPLCKNIYIPSCGVKRKCKNKTKQESTVNSVFCHSFTSLPFCVLNSITTAWQGVLLITNTNQ